MPPDVQYERIVRRMMKNQMNWRVEVAEILEFDPYEKLPPIEIPTHELPQIKALFVQQQPKLPDLFTGPSVSIKEALPR